MELAYLVTLLTLPSLANAWHIGAHLTPARIGSSKAGLRMLAEETTVDFDFGEPGAVSTNTVQVLEEEEEELTEQQKEIARLRAAEKFMKKDTGDAVCRTCGYSFKMEAGDGYIPRNTPFQLLPDSWACPNCKSPKAFFDPVQVEIAGFADNQAYGFGSNTMTESQKSGLIFGRLRIDDERLRTQLSNSRLPLATWAHASSIFAIFTSKYRDNLLTLCALKLEFASRGHTITHTLLRVVALPINIAKIEHCRNVGLCVQIIKLKKSKF